MPQLPELKPSEPKLEQVVPKRKPIEWRPVELQKRPIQPEQKLVQPQRKPVEPERKTIDLRRSSIQPELKPVEAEQKTIQLLKPQIGHHKNTATANRILAENQTHSIFNRLAPRDEPSNEIKKISYDRPMFVPPELEPNWKKKEVQKAPRVYPYASKEEALKAKRKRTAERRKERTKLMREEMKKMALQANPVFKTLPPAPPRISKETSQVQAGTSGSGSVTALVRRPEDHLLESVRRHGQLKDYSDVKTPSSDLQQKYVVQTDAEKRKMSREQSEHARKLDEARRERKRLEQVVERIDCLKNKLEQQRHDERRHVQKQNSSNRTSDFHRKT